MSISECKDLVDIQSITVDKALSREERIAEYLRQIKDPYFFRCGKFIVQAKFANNGMTLEDCLQRLLNE